MGPEDICLRRYRELHSEKPEIFENPPACPTTILFDAGEIKRAQENVLDERRAAGWETHDLRVGVLAEDPYIGHVIRDAVQFSDGKLGLYNRVVAPDGIVVLPIRTDGSVALIRIFRHPARRWFLEAPQGLVLPGDDPEKQARQELVEEMGATVGNLTSLGAIYTSTGVTSENMNMFAAWITAIGPPQLSEGIESIHTIPKSKIDSLVLDGTICDGPTISLILHARLRGLF